MNPLSAALAAKPRASVTRHQRRVFSQTQHSHTAVSRGHAGTPSDLFPYRSCFSSDKAAEKRMPLGFLSRQGRAVHATAPLAQRKRETLCSSSWAHPGCPTTPVMSEEDVPGFRRYPRENRQYIRSLGTTTSQLQSGVPPSSPPSASFSFTSLPSPALAFASSFLRPLEASRCALCLSQQRWKSGAVLGSVHKSPLSPSRLLSSLSASSLVSSLSFSSSSSSASGSESPGCSPAATSHRGKCDFPRRVCIVGAGPAGFYCAKYLQKAVPDPSSLQVDMVETLPSPYGLVRYGVAPDHPEVKHVTEDFDFVARQPGFRFFGNVTLGTDISLDELRSLYDAVILAYGAAGDKPLRIPGVSDLRGCLSAREFVGFYNAHPRALKKALSLLPDLGEAPGGLQPPAACVIGNGNVALDVARLLVKAREKLHTTDIHHRALDWFSHARIRHVSVIGRRGWMQSLFSNKELRELVTDDKILAVVDPDDFSASLTEASLKELQDSRLKQRSRALFEQMVDNWDKRESLDRPVVHLRFLTSPIRALPHRDDASRLGSLEVVRNRLEGPAGAQMAVPEEKANLLEQKALRKGEQREHLPEEDERTRRNLSSSTHENRLHTIDRDTPTASLSNTSSSSSVLPASLLIWSIGFKPVHAADLNLPLVESTGALVNDRGRVVAPVRDERKRITLGGVYASGWVRRGPRGVIATNVMDARETADRVLSDLDLSTFSISFAGAGPDSRAFASPPSASRASPSPASVHKAVGPSSGVAADAREQGEKRRETKHATGKREGLQQRREANALPEQPPRSLDTLLRQRAVQPVNYTGWLRVKEEEKRRGKCRDKSAEKIACVEEMLKIAQDRQSDGDSRL
ncbi:pyridine nucleotide-disulfide oxidoreductase domain-containing protein [Toxoplasma gondii TgCatPRC2]|uniref:Pyridine nucleotide-disulfide oxidoreductase domain-containing protein n=1 Tax=Toxoplasma gondii TgCatPRC2 TaxID=1130821 RepID=A0A151HMF2_TOXGO|nr:pyridine nucleotide-disulfide oxidoreductase domain-containing protein [Toxoplasma gondii TgCatPRC2]